MLGNTSKRCANIRQIYVIPLYLLLRNFGRMKADRRELFLRLQDKAANAHRKYVDAMVAFSNSNSDPKLKEVMEQMNTEQRLAIDQFQSNFPKHSIW